MTQENTFNKAIDDAFKQAGVTAENLKKGDVITEEQWTQIMKLMSRKKNLPLIPPEDIPFPIDPTSEE